MKCPDCKGTGQKLRRYSLETDPCPRCKGTGLDQPLPRGRFDGPAYEPEHDQVRLASQIDRIYNLMKDARWRTLGEIEDKTGDPQASISAQLRHLRKERFGSHRVDKRRRGDPWKGLYEYRLTVNPIR